MHISLVECVSVYVLWPHVMDYSQCERKIMFIKYVYYYYKQTDIIEFQNDGFNLIKPIVTFLCSV